MNEFVNILNQQKFRATNASWNYLCLNAPWSVGYVSTLIELVTFNTKEAWEKYYYQSGKERNDIIAKQFIEKTPILNHHTLKKTDSIKIQQLSWELKNLNFQYGRTKEQLTEKGEILFNHMFKKGVAISLGECIECVRFRTICETWNGIIIRERNTVQKLKEIFPDIEFCKTNGQFDHQYAVDYELKINGSLICGVQIKPKSYTYKTPYLNKARTANKHKNITYKTQFGKSVFDVIAQTNGTILNKEIITEIHLTIQKHFEVQK